jgi:hypothetical protein
MSVASDKKIASIMRCEFIFIIQLERIVFSKKKRTVYLGHEWQCDIKYALMYKRQKP